MQIQRYYYGVRGSTRILNYGLRWMHMITDQAKHKARVLAFWHTYGLKATEDAFSAKGGSAVGGKISKRTLQYWQAQLKKGGDRLEALNEKSKKPHKIRTRVWPLVITQEIKRIRILHPNLGKDKIHPFLKAFCTKRNLSCPSVPTIGRLIADAPDKMRLVPFKVRHNGKIVPRKRAKKERKPKGFVATHPGHCIAFDTVERIIHGSRRYVITATDLYSRFGLALATKSHASLAAGQFFQAIQQCFPHPIEYVLTDNGSEFMLHFDEALRAQCKQHWHTYPRTPKMNAHCERFNRTIQEEFVDFHEASLLDPATFNRELADYLVWYNTERPHWGLGLKSPLQFLMKEQPEGCKMWWTDTKI